MVTHCAEVFNEGAFLGAMSVVLAAAVYLPAAQCFALVPLLSSLRRSGREAAATIDYDSERDSVTITAGVELRQVLSTAPLIQCRIYEGQVYGPRPVMVVVINPEYKSDTTQFENSTPMPPHLHSH